MDLNITAPASLQHLRPLSGISAQRKRGGKQLLQNGGILHETDSCSEQSLVWDKCFRLHCQPFPSPYKLSLLSFNLFILNLLSLYSLFRTLPSFITLFQPISLFFCRPIMPLRYAWIKIASSGVSQEHDLKEIRSPSARQIYYLLMVSVLCWLYFLSICIEGLLVFILKFSNFWRNNHWPATKYQWLTK